MSHQCHSRSEEWNEQVHWDRRRTPCCWIDPRQFSLCCDERNVHSHWREQVCGWFWLQGIFSCIESAKFVKKSQLVLSACQGSHKRGPQWSHDNSVSLQRWLSKRVWEWNSNENPAFCCEWNSTRAFTVAFPHLENPTHVGWLVGDWKADPFPWNGLSLRGIIRNGHRADSDSKTVQMCDFCWCESNWNDRKACQCWFQQSILTVANANEGTGWHQLRMRAPVSTSFVRVRVDHRETRSCPQWERSTKKKEHACWCLNLSC